MAGHSPTLPGSAACMGEGGRESGQTHIHKVTLHCRQGMVPLMIRVMGTFDNPMESVGSKLLLR